jgi:hypothetical protein
MDKVLQAKLLKEAKKRFAECGRLIISIEGTTIDQ